MNILLTLFFTSFTTLAVIHFFATKFFLYWKYFWFDIPMHVFGGVCVAFGFAILPFFRIQLPSRYTTLKGYIGAVLCVGILWEVFEYFFGLSGFAVQNDFIFDTVKDLIMDMLGGVIAYGVIMKIKQL